jgi:hypothetical protein
MAWVRFHRGDARVLLMASALVASVLALLGAGQRADAATGTFGTGTPVFANYSAPSSLNNSDNAGEPSIGINWNTGAVMYQAYSSTYRVAFDDSTVPATSSWTDTNAPNAINIDPILSTDSTVGRTWAGGELGSCSQLAFSDNDGGSWTPSNPCSGTLDHETIGSGPWAGSAPLGATYGRALYYCAQAGVQVGSNGDACTTSTNGGLSWGPSIPVSGCGGLHGHVKVSADGTAYLPNRECDLSAKRVGGGITRNNGSTWTSYSTPQTSPDRGFDPSVTTTPDNTVYEAWARAGDYHPVVAKSSDHGATWSTPVDLAATVSPGLVASTFQAMTSGDNGRIAVAFLGTSVGTISNQTSPFDNGFHGVWYLYVSYSYDGGQTWTTVNATPNDPVQRGCIWDGGGSNVCRNLLDFMDASVTKDGRVVVGYADGCLSTCAGSSGTESQSTDAYATIARQSSGKGLFSANDVAGTNDFSISASPSSLSLAPGSSGSSTIATAVTSGSTQSVSLAATGQPSGTTVSLAPNPISAGQSSTMTVNVGASTAPGTYTITVTGTGASATHTTQVGLTVVQASDFSITANPSSLTVVRGKSGSSTISTTVTSGSGQSVSLSATGQPSGTTVGFNPNPITSGASSTMSIRVGKKTAPGTYTITVTGTGTSATHTTTVTLTVTT